MNLLRLRNSARRYGTYTWQRSSASPWLVLVLVFVALCGVLLGNLIPKPVHMVVGQVAKRDVEASRRIINRYRTDQLREAAAKAAVREAATQPANYEINQATVLHAEEAVEGVFRVLRGEAAIEGEQNNRPSLSNTDAVRQYIHSKLSVNVPRESLHAGSDMPDARLENLEVIARKIASDIMRTQRITEETLPDMQELAGKRVAELNRAAPDKTLLAGVVKAVLAPNLVLDPQKVERAREQAMRAVPPVYVEQGQMIVRKGDLVQPEHVTILRDLGLLGQKTNYSAVLGVVTIVMILLAMMVAYVYRFHRDLAQNRQQQLLLGLTLVFVTSLAKLASLVPFEGSGFLVPTALAGILLTVLLDSRLAMMAVIFLTVIVGVVMGQDTKYVMIALVGGLTGVFSVSKISQRGDVTRAGLIVGLANFLAMIAFGLFRSEWFMVRYALIGAVNGLASAVLAIGLLPYMESVFGITSAIRLLELSNPNHPLLKALLLEAPGSYHHSMIVGNLAEAAAEAVGADALLAHVQSQYHDIGKTRRPYFYIENQYGGDNPHDRIAPSLSTLIITSHVKDGLELAKQYKLPKAVYDVIPQHHGTDLVRYFYHKAMENAKGEPVDEKDFRYPGPRPQTKETAIVMLADSVEAAVRSIARPTPGRIEGMVRKMIKERLNDGQLDESDITFRDLDLIAEAFVRVLTGIFHHRIEYPDIPGVGDGHVGGAHAQNATEN